MNPHILSVPFERVLSDANRVEYDRERNAGFMADYSRGFLVTRAGLSVNSTGYVDHNILYKYPGLLAATLEMGEHINGEIFQCWLGSLDPMSGDLATHTDGELPGNPVRYHLPIKTNWKALYWSESTGEVHLDIGYWWGPIEYTKPHRAWNKGTTARVHLVADYLI